MGCRPLCVSWPSQRCREVCESISQVRILELGLGPRGTIGASFGVSLCLTPPCRGWIGLCGGQSMPTEPESLGLSQLCTDHSCLLPLPPRLSLLIRATGMVSRNSQGCSKSSMFPCKKSAQPSVSATTSPSASPAPQQAANQSPESTVEASVALFPCATSPLNPSPGGQQLKTLSWPQAALGGSASSPSKELFYLNGSEAVSALSKEKIL